MTPLEIFSNISQHQISGIMFHQQLADMFDFMGLKGEKRLHEYQLFSEMCSLRGIHRYCINHCNQIITEGHSTNPTAIPTNWKGENQLNVSASTKKDKTEELINKWVAWESTTKKLYQTYFKSLTDDGQIASANKVNELIKEVDKELKCATKHLIEYKSVNWDLGYIMWKQDELHEKYKNKLKDGFKIEYN